MEVFSPDLSRRLNLTHTGKASEKFPGYNVWEWTADMPNFQNSTANPSNWVFGITVDGTSNLTSTYGVTLFVSQGDFCQCSNDAGVVAALPINASSGEPFVPGCNGPYSYEIDHQSGTTLSFLNNMQQNYQVFNDDLIRLTSSYTPVTLTSPNPNPS